MEGVSSAASVFALYQWASEITKLSINYGPTICQGSPEMRLFMDGIAPFQACVARLAQPLEDRVSEMSGEDVQGYQDLVNHLRDLHAQLEKTLSSHGVNRQLGNRRAMGVDEGHQDIQCQTTYDIEKPLGGDWTVVPLQTQTQQEIEEMLDYGVAPNKDQEAGPNSARVNNTTNQDPNIPDIPPGADREDRERERTYAEYQGNQTERKLDANADQPTPRLQTASLWPSETLVASPETPLELRWLDQRFRPDSNTSLQSADPPPASQRGSEMREQTATGGAINGPLSRADTFASVSEYSQESPQRTTFSNPEGVPQHSAPPLITTRRPTQDGSIELAATEATEIYGPFGLRADTSPTTTIGHLSQLPEERTSFQQVLSSQRTDQKVGPSLSPEEANRAAASQPPHPFSDAGGTDSHEKPNAERMDSSQQNGRQPDSAATMLPPGLRSGNGARRGSDSPPKPLPKDTPPQSMTLTKPPDVVSASQESRAPGRSIPAGLLPGRPAAQSPPSNVTGTPTPQHAWENRSYNRTSILPPKPGQLPGAPGHHGSSSEGRFPLYMYSVPTGSAAPLYPDSASPVAFASSSTGQMQRAPQRPLRTAYAQHQHAQSVSHNQGHPSAPPRPFAQQEQSYPPRQSSLDSSDPVLPPPPSFSDRAGRHSVIGLGPASNGSPTVSSGHSSPYTAVFNGSPFGSPPAVLSPPSLPTSAHGSGPHAFAAAPPTSYSDSSVRPPLRRHGESGSSPRLGTVALPAEVSLGFGRDMRFSSFGRPHDTAIELPTTAEPPELPVDHPGPSSGEPIVSELDPHAPRSNSPYDYPANLASNAPTPSDTQFSLHQIPTDHRSRPAMEPRRPSTSNTTTPNSSPPSTATTSPPNKRGAAARITAAAARAPRNTKPQLARHRMGPGDGAASQPRTGAPGMAMAVVEDKGMATVTTTVTAINPSPGPSPHHIPPPGSASGLRRSPDRAAAWAEARARAPDTAKWDRSRVEYDGMSYYGHS